MIDPRFDDDPGDAALDREIEQALAIDPRPDFLARARARLADRRRNMRHRRSDEVNSPLLALRASASLPSTG